METTNNVRKTGNKKFQKVTISVFAAVLGMMLISFVSSAQGFWIQLSENNSLIKMSGSTVDKGNGNALLLASASPIFFANSVEIKTFRVEKAKEKSLEIESWMIDSKYFGQTNSYVVEQDEPLVVENWMTNERNFSCSSVTIVNETEMEMQIEDWMKEAYLWGN